MRLLVLFVGMIGLIIGSVWLALVAMLLLAIRYRAWEIIIMGLMLDFVWQPSGMMMSLPIFTFVAILMVWVFEPVRAQFLS